MKEYLRLISKLLYGLTFLSFFLPAFVPACSKVEHAENSIADSLATLVIVDSTTKTNITTATTSSNVDSTEEESKLLDLFYPDRQNQSFWGYLVYNSFECIIALFCLLSVWSGILRFLNIRELEVAIQSSFAFCFLMLFIVLGYSDVVWGFWITFYLSLATSVTNWFLQWKNRLK